MTRFLPLAALLGLAACAAPGSLGPPVSSNIAFNGHNLQLEPPNSLPPGFTTTHPFPPSTGTLTPVRVGP